MFVFPQIAVMRTFPCRLLRVSVQTGVRTWWRCARLLADLGAFLRADLLRV